MKDPADLRRDYQQRTLEREDLADQPHEQFTRWFDEACRDEVHEPNAMVLATVSPEGAPSQRTVLLKAHDPRGFVFYTNYESRKSREIEANPKVCLLFPWLHLERQLIIRGTATKISSAESLKYFISRPLGSQLGAWSSKQSAVVESRRVLEAELEKIKSRFSKGEVPLPSFWGGYRVEASEYEFWQGRSNRLHDRFRYRREGGDWQIERLAP